MSLLLWMVVCGDLIKYRNTGSDKIDGVPFLSDNVRVVNLWIK